MRRQRGRGNRRRLGTPRRRRRLSHYAAILPGGAPFADDRRRPLAGRSHECRGRTCGDVRIARRGARRRSDLYRDVRAGACLHVRTLCPHAWLAAADGGVAGHAGSAEPAVRLGRATGRHGRSRSRLDSDVLRNGAGDPRHHRHGLQDRRAPRRHVTGKRLS